jgi:3-hydroxy acid dehydrogenase/malonic semialdehyde reductase
MSSKVVCITGASAGIGLALAEIYAEHGWHLVLGARRRQRLEDLEGQLRDKGAASVLSLNLDVRDADSVAQWTEAAFARHPQVDVLINNAGLVLGTDSIETGRLEDWATVLDTNVMGVLRLCRAFIPRFRQQNAGHIVMMGSISGHQVYEGGGPYCASKFSVKALSRTLRLELNGTPIRVSSIDPGMVETEFSLVRFQGDAERAKNVYKGLTPLQARDIADCVWFATSRPPHVNIDDIIVMPTAQASVYKVHRQV